MRPTPVQPAAAPPVSLALTRLVPYLLAVLLLAAPVAHAEDPVPTDPRPGVPAELRAALLAGDTALALRQLETLAAEDTDHLDLWTAIRAKTLVLAERPDDARAILESFPEQFPESRWRHIARFLLSEVLRTSGDVEGAERILEEETARLRSPERIGELADVYLGLADRLSTPSDPSDLDALPLDHGRARVLYEMVIELEAPIDRLEQAYYRRAYCLQQREHWDGAVAAYFDYLSRFDADASPDASLGLGARVFSARFELGRCLRRRGDETAARRIFQDLDAAIEEALAGEARWTGLPTDDDARTGWRTIQAEALREGAWTWVPFDEGDLEVELAVATLRRLVERFPASPLAPRASFTIGDWLAGADRPDEAIEAWTAYRASPVRVTEEGAVEEDTELRREALFRIGRTRLAQGRHEDAIASFREYATLYPTGEHWAAAQMGIIDAEYLDGLRRYEAGEFEEARRSWSEFLVRHPLDARAPQILDSIASSYGDEARRRLREDPEADRAAVEGLWRSAIDEWRRLVAKYPGDGIAQRARFRIGRTFEDELLDPDAAISTYRECSGTSYEGQARARLLAMIEQSLVVSTERTWRGGETAKLRVRCRNIESLEVAIHPLDLEAYFRKHHTHEGIDRLDLDLIAPAEELTIPVPDYREHLPLTRDIEIPVEGPGVWAVTVTADDLRASCLVVRSDLDVIVKSSRREVLVFAQSMPDDAPAEGVRVLVDLRTPEGSTIREVRTGSDGVVRVRFDELASGSAVRVFAEREDHVASVGLSLDGLSLSSGPQPRAAVYTDRRAYRPGHEVQWRAVIREVEDGRYTFEPGRTYRVEARAPSGEAWWRGEAVLGEFGTLHGTLRLSALAPLGTHQIVCSTPNGPSFTGEFLVEEYVPRRVELTLSTERTVVYRGEEIELTARALFYYGEPLADSPLRIELPDGRVVDARTDDEGVVRIPFGTRELPWEGPIEFSAQLPEEDVEASWVVYLATRGYELAVDLSRDLFLSGTPVPVTVRATTPDGEPAERTVSLRVERYEEDAFGDPTPVTIEEHELTTDAEGEARIALRLDRGGRYRLRAEGIDRFDNPVSGEAELTISGEEDAVKLRVLTERTRVDVGETLEVDLHHRGEPGLALVTFEGEEVLEYRLVRLDRGGNPLELAIDSGMFPSFRIAVARMAGRELLEAGASFEVSRQLRIELTTPDTPVRPGESATVGVRVTDALGTPVEAEVSLAVVDSAVTDLHDFELDLVERFDAGLWREPALRTVSSCVFRYEGTTRTIADAVLDELARSEEDVRYDARRLEELAKMSQDGVQVSIEAMREFRGPSITVGAAQSPGLAGQRGGGAANFSFGGEDDAFDKDEIQELAEKRKSQRPRMFLGLEVMNEGEGEAPGRPVLDRDTAFWTPAIVTDRDGRAEVTFPVPERSTRWSVNAQGVTRVSQFGGGSASFVSQEDRFLEIVAPPRFIEGDTPRIIVRAHHLGDEPFDGTLTVTAVAEGVDARFTFERTIAPGRPVEFLTEALAALPGTATLVITAELAASDGVTVTATDEIPVDAWGMESIARAAGELTDEAAFELVLPTDGPVRGRELRIFLGAGLDPILVEAALGGAGWDLAHRRIVLPTHAARANELLGVLEVLGRSDGSLDSGTRRRLRQRSEGLTATLVTAQTPDGGWAWTGDGAPHLETSTRVSWALARARAAGRAVPSVVLDRGVSYLEAQFRDLPQQATERKAMLLHALTLLDAGDFGAANRLHRGRESLSPAALAHLTLTLAAMDRANMASETAELLERAGDSRGRWPLLKNRHWQRDPLGMDALALLAFLEARPRSERVGVLVDRLVESQPWCHSPESGLAIAALARHQGETVPARARLEITVSTGGEAPVRVLLDETTTSRTLDLPLGDGPGRAPITLRAEGRGSARYAAVLRGFTTEVTPREEPAFAIRHHLYEAVAPRHRGRAMSTGFSVLSDSDGRWRNLVEELPRGRILDAELELYDRRRERWTDDHARYLEVEIPIPSGTRLLSSSLSGNIDHHVVRDGRLVVHVRKDGSAKIGYSLIAFLPGEYRALPPVIRSLPEPDRVSIGAPQELRVLPRDGTSSDEYRPTPDELYLLGRAHYADGEFDEAERLLTALHSEFEERLDGPVLRETATMLFFLSIRREDAASIVRFFEVLKEKNPDLDIPFDRVIRVGEAYRQIGEHARAMLVFRAVIEETFGQDLRIPGVLEAQDDLAEALATLDRLIAEYPPIPTVVESWLTLADKRLVAAPGAGSDASLRRAGLDRAGLQGSAIRGLERFLALHPDNPIAPDAGLNLVTAHLGLENYAAAAALGGTFAELYDDPRYIDNFLYTRAVAEWYLGQDREALDRLGRIADLIYTDEDGVERKSENRELALYILGQIHHARREFSEASRFYEKVEDEFSDAREALEGFREKSIEIDEVTTARPGEEISLGVRTKNLSTLELLVYDVDLMTLYLRERNLSNVTAVNLAGITPTLRLSVDVPEPEEAVRMVPVENDVALSLPEAGAYLVICRGADLHSSALVLVSELELRVVEDPISGRVRVQALDADEGTFVRDVDVRVIGSGNSDFVRGESDPRGLFVADGIRGRATVIARIGTDDYAFHRGEIALGMQRDGDVRQQMQRMDEPAQLKAAEYFRNVLEFNDINQDARLDNFQREAQQLRKGVKVKQAQ